MAIDWNLPLRTRDGRDIKLLPLDGWQRQTGNTKRRGQVCNFLRPKNETERESMTTWLYDESGRCRGDGAESDLDAVNVAVAEAA